MRRVNYGPKVDVWELLALIVSMALGVFGIIAIGAGAIMLADRVLP